MGASRSEEDARNRVVIEAVAPEIDGGRFPIKRTPGEEVVVEASVFAEGHDVVVCEVLHGSEDGPLARTEMAALGNDRWHARFRVAGRKPVVYTVEAWVDSFRSWRRDMDKRVAADQDVAVELAVGAALVAEAAARARAEGAEADADALAGWAERLAARDDPDAALDDDLAERMRRWPDRRFAVRHPRLLRIEVERERARFSAWYELFPLSAVGGERHGTFRDVERWLPYVAGLGFDVLYFPPIHPIGRKNRKGKNNAVRAEAGDVGSPWAIGAAEGGHKAVHPDLGTLEDFGRLVTRAREHDIDVALDVALQCAPDHPYVAEHPQWFRQRPDGSIRYAENPPKRYEDIVPFDFETEDWRALWEELASIFVFWAERGVRVFRVDNPHTKPFAFWEWCLAEVKKEHPDTIFLSEAFTRPRVMYRLAKLGFSQSYTYFAWRHTPSELRRYVEHLVETEVVDYFRPNFWPNTPDILTEYLQTGGRPAFQVRAVLAATLASCWGIYGPAFELCEGEPREPGSEEYLDSEKYQLRAREPRRGQGIADLVARLNRIRKDNPAFRTHRNVTFHDVDNEWMLCFSKRDEESGNTVVVVANLDPHHAHSGWVTLDLEALGVDTKRSFQVHDLIGEGRYLWEGPRNFVRLDPQQMPAQVFRIRHRLRTERDFEYYL